MKLLIKIFFIFICSKTFSQNIDCVGSSITYNGYPWYANNLMVANGYTWRVHDYGVPGAGVVQIPYANTSKYEEVVQRESEIVILLLGVNDLEWYANGSQSTRDISAGKCFKKPYDETSNDCPANAVKASKDYYGEHLKAYSAYLMNINSINNAKDNSTYSTYQGGNSPG